MTQRPRSWPGVAVLGVAVALGLWTRSEVLAEQPIAGEQGAVWGIFDRACIPQRVAILVERPGNGRDEPVTTALVQRLEGRHDIDIPEGYSLVEHRGHTQLAAEAAWMCIPPTGGPGIRTEPITVDGVQAVRLVTVCDGEVSSTTYVREGRRVRLVSASAHGQAGPFVALFDGAIVAVVAFGLLSWLRRRLQRAPGAAR